MVGCVLSPSKFYILSFEKACDISFEKGFGLRPRSFSKLRM